MANSALHAVTVLELRQSNPLFYQEYCKLIEGISNQIRGISKQCSDTLDYTSFTESYDRASHEPVLQIVIGTHKTNLYIRIYIHKENYFVLDKSEGSQIAKNAQEVLELIAQKIKTTPL